VDVLKPLHRVSENLATRPVRRRTLLGPGLVALVLGSGFDEAFEVALSVSWAPHDEQSEDR
jgi:hypothetical protein